jgi:hypothetical protein
MYCVSGVKIFEQVSPGHTVTHMLTSVLTRAADVGRILTFFQLWLLHIYASLAARFSENGPLHITGRLRAMMLRDCA